MPKGPGKGSDLATVTGSTPQLIGRNACKQLWYTEEIKEHMLSPKSKQKEGVMQRTDFSPVRKKLFKGKLFSFFEISRGALGTFLISVL